MKGSVAARQKNGNQPRTPGNFNLRIRFQYFISETKKYFYFYFNSPPWFVYELYISISLFRTIYVCFIVKQFFLLLRCDIETVSKLAACQWQMLRRSRHNAIFRFRWCLVYAKSRRHINCIVHAFVCMVYPSIQVLWMGNMRFVWIRMQLVS